MIQSDIVLLGGGITALLGAIANLKYFGIKQTAIFLAFIGMLIYFAYYQVNCLVKGSCVFSSWLSAALAISTFSGIGIAYYYAIQSKTNPIQNKQLLEANPWLSRTASFIQNRYNYTILE
jgi:hypothetical protein